MTGSREKPIKIVFIGTSELGVPALRLLADDRDFQITGIITQPDKPAGRGLQLKQPAVKQAAMELNLPFIQPPSLRDPSVIRQIEIMAPDVIATAAYGLWIPEEVFDMPEKRTLNLHPSLLPRHRGAAPAVSAILDGDKEAGISVLFVEDEMDEGDILGQISLSLGEKETAEELMKRCPEEGAAFFVETIRGWMNDNIRPVPQDHSKKSWFGRMEKAEGLINWKLSAEEIDRRCRALTPWPGTYTTYNGKRLLIHETALISPPPEGNKIPPGKIIRSNGSILAATGEGFLELKTLQLECRKKLNIQDFIRGRRNFIGSTLGRSTNYPDTFRSSGGSHF